MDGLTPLMQIPATAMLLDTKPPLGNYSLLAADVSSAASDVQNPNLKPKAYTLNPKHSTPNPEP